MSYPINVITGQPFRRHPIADTLDDLGLALCAPYEPDPAQQIRLWRTASDQ